MDLADINKVESRKRITVEAEKLREHASSQAKKIIKLKVAQDTAYWDLKQKQHQLENYHEKLQQNMVDVQMQYETVSGQYQDELRLRPETLNKVTSNREICDVLADDYERIKDTLSRCKADHAMLKEAYEKAGVVVNDFKQKQIQAEEKNSALTESFKEKLKLTTEHQNQLALFFSSSKQQTDEEIKELKNKLEATQMQRDDLLKIGNELTRDLDQQKYSIDMKDQNIISLQKDVERLRRDINSQNIEMKNHISNLEKELTQSNESVAALKKALTNQEDFTASIREQRDALQEKVSTLEEENSKLHTKIDGLQRKREELDKTNDSLVVNVVTLQEAIKKLENEVAEKNQLRLIVEKQIEGLTSQLKTLEMEKDGVLSKLTTANEVIQDKSTSIEQLKANISNYKTEIAELQQALQQCRITNEEKVQELNGIIEKKQNENISKGESISKLMNEIKICMDVRNQLQCNIDKKNNALELEKEKALENETKFVKQVERLEVVVKEKEKDLSKHMSVILELRKEKEELYKRIEGMQGTIDNIQKELTGPLAPRPPQEQPELDDNAVSLTPLTNQKNTRPSENRRNASEFAIPTRKQQQDAENLLYTIFSDSSVDDNAVDPKTVDRRFEAVSRRESLAPPSLSTLKRRRKPPQTQEVIKDDEDAISLSQLRDDRKKRNLFFRTKNPENRFKKFRTVTDSDI